MAQRLVENGASGLVLFNRFYQPGLNLETLEVAPRLVLSSWDEFATALGRDSLWTSACRFGD